MLFKQVWQDGQKKAIPPIQITHIIWIQLFEASLHLHTLTYFHLVKWRLLREHTLVESRSIDSTIFLKHNKVMEYECFQSRRQRIQQKKLGLPRILQPQWSMNQVIRIQRATSINYGLWEGMISCPRKCVGLVQKSKYSTKPHNHIFLGFFFKKIQFR